MSILDYYCFDLLPAVWHRDGTLTQAFRSFAHQRVQRFSGLKEVLLVGDATQHYWTHESPIDLVLRVDPKEGRELVARVERLAGTIEWQDHPVEFFAADQRHSADAIAMRFGPAVSLNRGTWHGVVSFDTEELLRPSSLVRRIAWLQYRVARLTDLEPYEWRIEREAFRGQKVDARFRTLAEIRYRIAALNSAINGHFLRLDRTGWRAANFLEQQIQEVDEMPDSPLPTPILRGLAQQVRWSRLLDDFIEQDERLRRFEALERHDA